MLTDFEWEIARATARAALQRAARATGGPWTKGKVATICAPGASGGEVVTGAFTNATDAEFVAQAREDVPLLARAVLEMSEAARSSRGPGRRQA